MPLEPVSRPPGASSLNWLQLPRAAAEVSSVSSSSLDSDADGGNSSYHDGIIQTRGRSSRAYSPLEFF